MYFMFVMGLCVLSLMATIYIMHVNMCGDSVPVSAMPNWVRGDSDVVLFHIYGRRFSPPSSR